MKTDKKVKQLAHFEIGWWKAHHRKQKKEFIDCMSKLYSLQFGIELKKAKSAVLYRVKAAKWHDKAEKFEDNRNPKQADIYWNKAEECLRKHFKILESLV